LIMTEYHVPVRLNEVTASDHPALEADTPTPRP
jgi:hypothetical protein